MEFNAYSMLVDFMWAGIFLFVAKMLREKIKILQSLFVPVSLLAGFIGLALGQNGFGIISFSSQFGSYAGLLIIAVFVSIGLRGFNFSAGGWKTNFDRIGSYYCFRNIGWAFQYAMPIIFAMVVLKIVAPEFVKDFSQLPNDMRTGLIEEGKRPVLGEETVSPMAIDPLAWHLLLILIPTGIGYLLTNVIQGATGLGVPSFSVGFLVAIVFHFVLKGIKADKYVDNRIISRMGSCATDFLVFFGVASIKIPVVIEYAVPFGLLMLFGIVWVVFHFTVIAPRLLKQEWFERGIYVYGYSTGVTAIGMALLRIVDPENKSCTLDDAAIVTPIESIIEIFALAAVPVACVQGNWIAAVTPILIYLAALCIVPVVFKWWHKHPGKAWDESEL